MPGLSRAPNNAQMIDPDKEAFSTAPHDDEYAPVHDADDHEHEVPGYSGGESSQMGAGYEDPAPSYGGYAPPRVDDETAYAGYSGAQSPQIGPTGRLQFPTARYDNA